MSSGLRIIHKSFLNTNPSWGSHQLFVCSFVVNDVCCDECPFVFVCITNYYDIPFFGHQSYPTCTVISAGSFVITLAWYNGRIV